MKVTTLNETQCEFPLTEMQYSYLLGSRDELPLGGVSCHVYMEFDGYNVNPIRLSRAWSLMFIRHAMMRAKIMCSGMQKIMEKPWSDRVIVYDFRDIEQKAVETELNKIRTSLAQRKMHTELGQTSGLFLSLLPGGKTRIHFDVDLQMCDVKSFQIILNDLGAAYAGNIDSEKDDAIAFADYISKKNSCASEEEKNAALYWQHRLESLPAGPRIPSILDPSCIHGGEYESRTAYLDKKQRTALENYASLHNTEAWVVMLAAFAAVLAGWGHDFHFILNVPLFERPVNKNFENAVADFTKLLILEIDFNGCTTFSEFLNCVNLRFLEDRKYSSYSSFKLQKQLAGLRNNNAPAAPIVFSCTPGTEFPGKDFSENLGNILYIVSQTPQVILDSQVYETQGKYLLVFITVKNLISKYVADGLFNDYVLLLKRLSDSADCWNTAPWKILGPGKK